MAERFKASQKKKQNARAPAKVPAAARGLEECDESPWKDKRVRVVCEGLHEGRAGKVQNVWVMRLGSGDEVYVLRVLEVETAAIFQCSSRLTLDVATTRARQYRRLRAPLEN